MTFEGLKKLVRDKREAASLLLEGWTLHPEPVPDTRGDSATGYASFKTDERVFRKRIGADIIVVKAATAAASALEGDGWARL